MATTVHRRFGIRETLKRILPSHIHQWLRGQLSRFGVQGPSPRQAQVRWGNLRRTEPFSRSFGYERGRPADRYYIEAFLERQAEDIKGRTLEVKDSGYTQAFGGSGVHQADVVDIDPDNPHATIIADLNKDPLPNEAYDCIILTQTLQFIYDFRSALCFLCEALRPGGVLLLTVPGITPIASRSMANTWYWAFTTLSIKRLLAEVFPPGSEINVDSCGNVLTAVAFLEGLGSHELKPYEFEVRDPAYPVVITARVVKR
jgi:SAM-dependent methyltransferase